MCAAENSRASVFSVGPNKGRHGAAQKAERPNPVARKGPFRHFYGGSAMKSQKPSPHYAVISALSADKRGAVRRLYLRMPAYVAVVIAVVTAVVMLMR